MTETRRRLMKQLVGIQAAMDHQDILTITAFMDDTQLAAHVARFTTEMNTIELQRSAACWVAVHKGPHSVQVVDLFGTDTLPTAFTAAARADVVQREIAALNPNCKVVVVR